MEPREFYRHVQVLPLPSSVNHHFFAEEDPFWYFEDCRMPQYVPIFHRDGWYYNRNTKNSWMEYKGRAFVCDGAMFRYELKLLNTRLLTEAQIKALMFLQKQKLISPDLKELLYLNLERNEIRKTYRDSKLWCHKIHKNYDDDVR